MSISKRKLWSTLFLSALATAAGFILASAAGRYLVIDKPQHADLIVVLAGDFGDVRAKHGLMLLRNGYAQQLVLDAPSWIQYGRSQSDAAEDYIRIAAPDQVGRVHVCSFSSDSTREELIEVSNCIHGVGPNARSAVIVTSNFHTRRALATARHMMPQYQWSVAAAPDSRFDVHWWHNREDAKTVLVEWQKLLWWTIIEQWSSAPHTDSDSRSGSPR